MRAGNTSGKIILLRWPIGLGPNGMSITLCGRSCGWTVWTKRWALRGKSAPRDVSFRISLQISSAREVIFRSAEGTMEHLNPSVLYGINMEYAEASVAAGSMMALITGQHQSAPESESCSYSECLNLSHAANMTFHEQQNIAHLVMEHSIPHDQTVCVPPASSAIKTRGNGISQPSHLELIRTKEELASFVVNQPALARQARMEMDSQTRCCSTKSTEADALMKAKMVAHPHYPRLVAAYIDCQKVGAPPEIIAQLEETSKEYQGGQQIATMGIGIDPELDQFMEAYCEMLTKYREELTKPFQEATMFLKKIETQLHNLTKSTVKTFPSAGEGVGSSEEEDGSCGEVDFHEVDPYVEDRELKDKLLRKYSGYFSSLKQEFLKKKKKGKLPKEARQKLLDWWNIHYKWPYPSESQKIALAESTGLDQKQINNWFINQRKRHWKPSEEMQFVVMDSLNPRNAALYMEGNLNTDGSAFSMDY